MKLFHIDLYDHQTSFYNVEKTFNSNFVRHHRHYCASELISTYCAFIFAKSYFGREVRLKNPQLIYEQHPSSKEEENITIIVILPLQAADFEKLSGGRLSEFITQDMNKSFCASDSEEDFTTIVMVFSTIQHRRS